MVAASVLNRLFVVVSTNPQALEFVGGGSFVYKLFINIY